MKSDELKRRTQQFAINVIELVEMLPKDKICEILSRQLVRAATSVGANYRAACRGKSRADFIAKMGIVLEEADETVYWMELLMAAKKVSPEKIRDLSKEAEEFVAIAVLSIKTAKGHSK